MICPVCNVELRMAERQGVEIDYCPKCRGIWLDRGELDKLIERGGNQPTTQEYPPVAAYPSTAPQNTYYRDDDDDDYEHKRQGNYGAPYQKKRKKNFLGEIFDFD